MKNKQTIEQFFDLIFKNYFKEDMLVVETETKSEFDGIHYRGPEGIEIKIKDNDIEFKEGFKDNFNKITPIELLNINPDLVNFYFGHKGLLYKLNKIKNEI
jgi:hypothetical protein